MGGQAFAAPHVIRVVRSQEGLVAPKLLNYGVTSGSLIPLLVIGFLGGATLAITLVSLQYHGVTVGPELFINVLKLLLGRSQRWS
ncbi:tripartite tricarboxylate transporter permease [Alphaproteobacteria bacterium]|nr:tripartite tricarboxylate transporter permease [Alphaproteobacteria bacterium]